MASKATAADVRQAEPALMTIEDLQARHRISRPVFAGVCAANGWNPGRAMTEEDFLQAVGNFTRAPMNERRKEDRHA
jgi:hypothetical protein